MIDRELSNQISSYWRQSDSPDATPAARLEAKLTAFQMLMTAVINGADGVQRFWDSTDLLTAILFAADDEPLDNGGTVRRDAWIKYQALFLSFRQWLNTSVAANLPTGMLDEDDNPIMMPVELEETPAMLIMRQPARVTQNQEI